MFINRVVWERCSLKNEFSDRLLLDIEEIFLSFVILYCFLYQMILGIFSDLKWYQPSFVLMHQSKSKTFLFSNFNLLIFHFVFFLIFYSFVFIILPVLAPSSPIWTCWSVLFRLEPFIQLKELFWRLIFGHMIDSDCSSAYFRSIEIINSQNSWPLILIG